MQRLLIIEHSSSSFSVCDALAAEASLAWERADWESFSPAQFDLRGIQLMLAVAVPLLPPAIAFLDWLRNQKTPLPMIIVFPADAEPSVIRMASQVADDFMLWPVHQPELKHRISRLLGTAGRDTLSTVERLTVEMGMNQLVGVEETFTRIVDKIPLIARTEAPVLITGETGTGKEMCARAIHFLSKRRAYPFIPVDCGALPDHLFENEVFGHVRGAYTDARNDQKGLAAMADRGTLFLDEVDSLSVPAQAKLLRFLQEKTYKPLGSDSFSHADVNVIAASNRDLEFCVAAKQFRADLFFRLNVLRLHLPPLRERRRDIGPLSTHFLRNLVPSLGRKVLSPAAIRRLSLYDWPGNVRELFNALHRAALFSEGPTILPSHISFGGNTSESSADASPETFREARSRAIEIFERSFVEDALRKHSGNVTHAALEARQDRRVFGRLLKKYSIDRKGLQRD